jgi:hypothetical protein
MQLCEMPNLFACGNHCQMDSCFCGARVELRVEAVGSTRRRLLRRQACVRPAISGAVHCEFKLEEREVLSQWETKRFATPFIRAGGGH